MTKKIETADKMLEYFNLYKKEVKENPKLIKDWVGKESTVIYREKERPLTLEGFENWLSENNIISNVQHYFSNHNNSYADYANVCRRIKTTIRADQIEGGMIGAYNPSITQRLNGLAEKIESKTEITDTDFVIERHPAHFLHDGIKRRPLSVEP